MEVTRESLAIGKRNLRLVPVLRELGVTRPNGPKRGVSWKGRNGHHWTFWQSQSDEELYDLLHSAKTAYRSKMKRAHSDKGGNHAKAVRLNQIWKFVLRQFKKHSYELL